MLKHQGYKNQRVIRENGKKKPDDILEKDGQVDLVSKPSLIPLLKSQLELEAGNAVVAWANFSMGMVIQLEQWPTE